MEEVHHLNYERLGCELDEDVVGVCRECHKFLGGYQTQDPSSVNYTAEEVLLLREMCRKASENSRDFSMWLRRLFTIDCQRWEFVQRILTMRIGNSNPRVR